MDAQAVARYEAWYESPKGAFVLAQEQKLVRGLISDWPRRDHSLLEIACGAGHFSKLFWEAGFEVTALDSSGAMLDAAQKRLGHKALLRLGHAEHLPFDDGEFDFAVMVTSLECMENPEAALAEAFRVACRGVLVVFLNSWSLYWLEQVGRTRLCDFFHGNALRLRKLRDRLLPRRDVQDEEPFPAEDPEGILPEDNTAAESVTPEPCTQSMLRRARWYSAWSMNRMAYDISGHKATCFRSALFAPSPLWRGQRAYCLPWAKCLPFGAVVGMRVDTPTVCVTPLPIRTGKAVPAS